VKTLLFYDCETTGLDPQTDKVIEFAVSLWSIPYRSVISNMSMIVQAPSNPCADLNGIPEALLPLGITQASFHESLPDFFEQADAIVAHNADFDSAFLPEPVRSMRPWICSCNDIDWGLPGSKSLTSLCLAMGLGVSHAHRAMADVSMLSRLFERACEKGFPLEEALEKALRPKAVFVAQVGFADRERAKSAGFRWDGDRKEWWKKMPVEDAEKLPFPVKERT
jgi:DNA polymerase III subunit epsilon